MKFSFEPKPFTFFLMAGAILLFPLQRCNKSTETDSGKIEPEDPIAEKGKQLFLSWCSNCHSPRIEMDGTAPALLGISKRVPNRKTLIEWIQNPQKVLASGDPYFVALQVKWKLPMTPVNLDSNQVESILKFIDSYQN